MAKYVVAEVGAASGESESFVDSLPAARVVAQRRVRASDRPVVIRYEETGQEIARYHPPKPTEPNEVNAVIAKLQGATDRMKGLLSQKRQRRRSTKKG
jgi:hypothetical protein